MDYQLIIFLDNKKLNAWDITEDGEAEEISIDGNTSMGYQCVEEFSNFAQYVCDAYNVDAIDEMDAGATIVNCGASADNCIALMDCLKDFKGIDAIDVKKLLPMVLQNKGLLEAGTKTVVSVMGNYFVVKCDADGIATVGKNRVVEDAIELNGSDFSLLYFFAANGKGGASKDEITAYESEIAKYKEKLENVQEEAEHKLTAFRNELEDKYATIVEEYAEYKKIVEEINKKKNNMHRCIGIFRPDWNNGDGDVFSVKRCWKDVKFKIKYRVANGGKLSNNDKMFDIYKRVTEYETWDHWITIINNGSENKERIFYLVKDGDIVDVNDDLAIYTDIKDNYKDAMAWYEANKEDYPR